MHRQIQQRLAELNQELEQGNARLLRLERERAQLRETLLRIQGALLALKDLAADDGRQDRAETSPEQSAELAIPVAAGDEACAADIHPQSIEGDSHD